MLRLKERWRPEAQLLLLDGRDSAPPADGGAELDEWLRMPGRGDHAIVACLDQLEGIVLTLGVARALGGDTLVTRVSTVAPNALDDHVERHTASSEALATTRVESIAELGSDPERIQELSARQRLRQALDADARGGPGRVGSSGRGDPRPPRAGGPGGPDLADPAGRAAAAASAARARSARAAARRPAQRDAPGRAAVRAGLARESVDGRGAADGDRRPGRVRRLVRVRAAGADDDPRRHVPTGDRTVDDCWRWLRTRAGGP